jgi:hypothetical protein
MLKGSFAPFAAIGWRRARVFSHLEIKHRQAQVAHYVKAVS